MEIHSNKVALLRKCLLVHIAAPCGFWFFLVISTHCANKAFVMMMIPLSHGGMDWILVCLTHQQQHCQLNVNCGTLIENGDVRGRT